MGRVTSMTGRGGGNYSRRTRGGYTISGSGSRRRTDNTAYSRYGHLGKGLTDVGMQRYNARERAKLTSGYDRYLFDVKSMTFVTNDSTQRLKGMYQLPGSPKYAGGAGSFERAVGGSSAQGALGITTGYAGGPVGGSSAPSGISPFGGLGMADWIKDMFGANKYGKAQIVEEEPEPTKKILTLGALGLLVWKGLL